MNQNIWLKIGGVKLSINDLKSGKFISEYGGQERSALQFCFQWLNDQASFEFQTSGSTGIPKKIIFRRAQLIASASLTAQALQLKPGYNALVCLDVNFIAGAMMLVRAMVTGMNMVVAPPASDPLQNIHDSVDFAAFVPLQIAGSIQKNLAKTNTIKKIIIGGAAINEKLSTQIQRLSNQVYATYGMTETITHIALQKLSGSDRESYFRLLPGISCSVDDRSCLMISAPHLDAPVITNDVAELLGENQFRWIGRYDRVINSGGVKVQAEKIEAEIQKILEAMGLLNRFFISGIKDQHLGEKVTLIMEGSLPVEVTDQIVEQLASRLSKYEIPKEVFQIDQFKETSTQKVDRIQTLKNLMR